jgi:hypothetical protein
VFFRPPASGLFGAVVQRSSTPAGLPAPAPLPRPARARATGPASARSVIAPLSLPNWPSQRGRGAILGTGGFRSARHPCLAAFGSSLPSRRRSFPLAPAQPSGPYGAKGVRYPGEHRRPPGILPDAGGPSLARRGDVGTGLLYVYVTY